MIDLLIAICIVLTGIQYIWFFDWLVKGEIKSKRAFVLFCIPGLFWINLILGCILILIIYAVKYYKQLD